MKEVYRVGWLRHVYAGTVEASLSTFPATTTRTIRVMALTNNTPVP